MLRGDEGASNIVPGAERPTADNEWVMTFLDRRQFRGRLLLIPPRGRLGGSLQTKEVQMSKWLMKTSLTLPVGAAATSLLVLACGVAEGPGEAGVEVRGGDRTPATVVSPAEGEVRC